MTVSDFEVLKNQLLIDLRKHNKKNQSIIKKNSKLIDNYLNGSDLTYVNEFVKDFNDVLLDRKVNKYKYFEAVLKNDLFKNVLNQFRESDILIRALKDVKEMHMYAHAQSTDISYNEDLLKWLLTMNINYGVQDEKGMTALMYAVKYKKLYFVVDEIMNGNGKHIYLLDKEGNNVLFHAAETVSSLKKFLKYKDIYDANHLNNNNENLILYCCKNRKIFNLDNLMYLVENYRCAEPNLTNSEGMTAAMYLTDHALYKELEYYIKTFKIDPNAVNKFGNSLVSVFIKKYYRYFTVRIVEPEGFGMNLTGFKRYAYTIKVLIESGCDFKRAIDEEGTTVVKILSLLEDKMTQQYLLENGCVDYLVEDKTSPNGKYQAIDMSNPVVKKNHKSVQMWIREALNPKGTINAQTTGLIMMALMK